MHASMLITNAVPSVCMSVVCLLSINMYVTNNTNKATDSGNKIVCSRDGMMCGWLRSGGSTYVVSASTTSIIVVVVVVVTHRATEERVLGT
mgnify:FL=1